jgi:hypothetical protein
MECIYSYATGKEFTLQGMRVVNAWHLQYTDAKVSTTATHTRQRNADRNGGKGGVVMCSSLLFSFS